MKRILLLAVLFLCARTAEAIVYQYFDEEGTLIVTNIQPGAKSPGPAPRDSYEPKSRQKYPDVMLSFRDDVNYDFYPVTAHTFQEAVMATSMNGPFDARENKRYAAQTKWNMGWSYSMRSTYRTEPPYVRVSLNIYDFRLRSDITVLLPILTEDSSLDEHDLMLWQKFVQVLLEHEHDHVALVKDASYRQEAMRRVSSISEITLDYDPAAVMEEAIKSAVEARTAKIGHDLIREIKSRNDEYDRLTEHGLKPEMRQAFFR